MRIEVLPTKKEMDQFLTSYIPEVDLYFFQTKPSDLEPILTKQVFLSSAFYFDIRYNNFYEYWNVLKHTNYIYIDRENKVSKLPKSSFENILKEQIVVQRGSILDQGIFTQLPYSIQGQYVLTNTTWEVLSEEEKKQAILYLISDYDDTMSYPCPDHLPKEFQNIINTYQVIKPCNCLGVVLYGMTKKEIYLENWIQRSTFEAHLKEYEKIDEDQFQAGDVLVFEKDGQLVHASYYLGEKNYFMNKSGQLPLNPITLKTLEDLLEEWEACSVSLYRKKESHN